MAEYVLGIDQSTQGTKAILFNLEGRIVSRVTFAHRQIINDKGWVSHDLNEIWKNTVESVKQVVEKAGIDKGEIRTVGISNQRETSAAWDRESGEPVCDAIVWQCSRAKNIAERIESFGNGEMVREKTGLKLSPYFPAAKWAWIFENVPDVRNRALEGKICVGTIDSWLVYKMTEGKEFRTDYSNASRTELFNLKTLTWDKELLNLFGIPESCMAEITDSNGFYGSTTFDGYLDRPISIHGVMGDSHAALLGQDCRKPGMVKSTYGTGSSIMMNTGSKPVFTKNGIVTSLAWSLDGKVSYVLENNINYTGAVITWLKDDLHMISSPGETEEICRQANPIDTTYLVPAFSGLGAPYWDSEAKATITGMTRTTGRNEIVKAGVESIAYQITEAVNLMQEAANPGNDPDGIRISQLRVDGGPTRNGYLMQMQSDLLDLPVCVPDAEELSAIGAAYAAGLAEGFYDETVFGSMKRKNFEPVMDQETRSRKMTGWKAAVSRTISR